VFAEALGRLLLAIALVGVGSASPGAYLGRVASIAVTAAALAWLLHQRLGAPDRCARWPAMPRCRSRRSRSSPHSRTST
jgi:hypothetical protein